MFGYYVKALGFTLCLSVPLLGPLGVAVGTYWLCPLLFFVILPLAGRLMGPDPTSHYPSVRPPPFWERYLDVLPYFYLPIWFAAFCWSAATISNEGLSFPAIAGVAFSLGIASAVSTCVSHEIMHRTGTLDQLFARAMVSQCGYGHLMLEHSYHHANVGDSSVGGTPRRGENAFAFVWRDARQGFRNAMAIEKRRLHRSRLSLWHNRIWQNYAIAAIFLAWFAWTWGAPAGALFIFQAAFSIFAVQMITYIQHYGLERKPGEQPTAHHSWADNCAIANALTFNINHHSQHHLEPRTPYYHLRTHPEAPRLPASYMIMFVLALVPPLWRLVMDRRLASHDLRVAEKHAIAEPG